uniref:COPA/B TPR domain-containing protein n=1 Tax=Zea mays TaxID=4577 RepID=A0A804QVW2_MAIZE
MPHQALGDTAIYPSPTYLPTSSIDIHATVAKAAELHAALLQGGSAAASIFIRSHRPSGETRRFGTAMAAAAADFRSRRSCGRHVHLYPLHLCPLNGVHSLCPAVWSKYRRWSMLEMAEECLLQAKDLSGLLLLYSSLGDAEGIEKLASLAKEHGKNNVAFLCLFMLGKVEDCIQLLVDSNRIPEAALLARSYLPSKVLEIVAIWRDDLSKINPKATESLADPSEYPNLFEDWQVALTVEKSVASQSF